MSTFTNRPDRADVAHVLGDELRHVRRARGWTRKQLQAHLPSRVSVQTLATYELGTRQCSMARLVELCHALGAEPADVVYAVDKRIHGDPRTITVNVRSLATSTDPALTTARHWATTRLAANHEATNPVAELSTDAVMRLAELSALGTTAFIAHLLPHIR